MYTTKNDLITKKRYCFMAAHNEFGKKGEEMAASFLMEKGYTILERNYRFGKAELDIIALKDSVLAVVEVKSRSEEAMVHPRAAITPKKIRLLTSAAHEYVIVNDLDMEIRFDSITIIGAKKEVLIEHIEDAFYHF